MTDTTTLEPDAPATEALSVSKTNLSHALHHYNMAVKSLDRAWTFMEGMGSGLNGAAHLIRAGWENHNGAVENIESLETLLEDVEAQRKAFLG